jgi:hypothetical protein
MNEEKIKEYVKNGGKLWHIDKISTIRDGGTIMLIRPPMTKLNPFYIHRDNWTIHIEYPLTDDNILTDENEREYIYDRLGSYLKGCENSVRLANRVIENLNNIKNDKIRQ